MGWIYFTAWSISFYPQVFLNFSRKSVKGLSFDYTLLNILGFTCYTAYNLALFYNPEIRAQYAQKHNNSVPSVHPSDVFFAIHAVALTAVIGIQIILFDKGGQRVSYTCLFIFGALVTAIGVMAILTYYSVAGLIALDFLTFLSFVKLAITLMKYLPQAILNWKLKSTKGWSIENILLDFTGGSLSLGQELMDSAVQNDWSNIAGNPVKFGLGLVSMVYDVIFMIQHYALYGKNNNKGKDSNGSNSYDDDNTIVIGNNSKGVYDNDYRPLSVDNNNRY